MTHDPFSSDQDLQALKQRLEALETQQQADQQRHQQAMTLFSEAPAPYLLLNSSGRILDVNSAASGLMGREKNVLLGKSLVQFLAPGNQGSFEQLLKQAAATGLRQRGEAQLLHQDGTPFDMLLDLDAPAADGDAGTFRVVMTDITAYKQAHRTLLDANASHEQAIQDYSMRVRVLNQELEQIVTVFLQQLHLPTARAMNFLGLLGKTLNESAAEVAHPLLNSERAVQQVIALLASMDRYMQVRSMRLRLRTVDLNSVLDDVLKKAQPQLVDRSIQLSADRLPSVQGDTRALYVALDELVGNAIKFTRHRDPARIRILARETATEHLIGVEDNGAGFNMRQKDKLFQLFGRLHSSKVFEGTGVGLVSVRRACERVGGRVWAEGKVDQGATFWFSWPKEPTIWE
ncbi:sensor histidine kinase [Deinococcus hohokamensis]|uniref:histidine kinase n=1 Tax=Deinococcus hohokamensis TaxID=309883 RepID=A0ABV9ICK5_9DEIO